MFQTPALATEAPKQVVHTYLRVLTLRGPAQLLQAAVQPNTGYIMPAVVSIEERDEACW